VISDGVKSIGDLIGHQSEYSQLLGEADAKNRLVIAGKNHRLVRGRTREYFIPSTEDNTWLSEHHNRKNRKNEQIANSKAFASQRINLKITNVLSKVQD
jgi:hypothetical protein